MKISCVLCTYNGYEFLSRQLASIFAQSLPVNEILVIDDCSTDGTRSLIESYIINYPNKIKFFINEDRLGAKKNFEKALTIADGDIIFLSDQDDVWLPTKVEIYVNYFNKHVDALMLFSDGKLIDENDQLIEGTLWEKWKFTKEEQQKWHDNDYALGQLIRNNNKITGATVAIRNKLKDFIFPFELGVGHWHDAWIGLVASIRGGLRFIEIPCIQYRIHQGQQVGIGNGITFSRTLDVKRTSRIKSEKNLLKFYAHLLRRFPDSHVVKDITKYVFIKRIFFYPFFFLRMTIKFVIAIVKKLKS